MKKEEGNLYNLDKDKNGRHVYFYNDFELDLDKISTEDVAQAINQLNEYDDNPKTEYVWWNPLGNYVSWNDGSGTSYYFTKKYLRVTGWDLWNPKEYGRLFEFIKMFKVVR